MSQFSKLKDALVVLVSSINYVISRLDDINDNGDPSPEDPVLFPPEVNFPTDDEILDLAGALMESLRAKIQRKLGKSLSNWAPRLDDNGAFHFDSHVKIDKGFNSLSELMAKATDTVDKLP